MPNRQKYLENPPKRLQRKLSSSSHLHFYVQTAAGSGIEDLSHQAAFAAFFFAFGSGAIVAFKFALEASFTAAQRLICA